jgi:hypothetical protein
MQGGLPDTHQEYESNLLDAGRDGPQYNKNSFPAHDPQGQYIGLETPLDNMYDDRNINRNSNHSNNAKYVN